ncbi:MAG: DUF4091 domain-containing protein [Muribaculaceae bacterium]|nr:DUF4091 domain-containing protein [Muribaculaceae bacterium]
MNYTSTLITAICLLINASAAADVRAYTEPTDTMKVDVSGWPSVKTPAVGWVSKDIAYRQMSTPPCMSVTDTTVTAWRGERIGLEALIASPVELTNLSVEVSGLDKSGRDAAPGAVKASFMRYVLSSDWKACGYPSDTLPVHTLPDMIDIPGTTIAAMAPNSVRPVWVSVEVPRDLAPGSYTLTLNVRQGKKQKSLGVLKATIEVLSHTLPAPRDYSFYLDLWQQPYSVSRYYGVEPWSDEHFRLMEPYVDMLARLGQNTVSAILFYEPWGEQSNDKFEPMVRTTRLADGTWKFDYEILDRWVDYMAAHGIDTHIDCFTMVPWQPEYRYIDATTGRYATLEAKPGSEAYNQLWSTFLRDFADHQKQRGLIDKTLIFMDERGIDDMLAAYAVAKEAAPELRMGLAGSYHPELIDSLYSYTLIKGDFFPADVIDRRNERNMVTLMYTCCATPAPSQFTNSDPADGAYLPVYATATGHDGYLHWSYMNWTDNPLEDTRFHMFAPGDTYFVYPDGRSSVRYERLLEGIQMSEKIAMLRNEFMRAGDTDRLEQLERALIPIRSGALNPWYPTSEVVNTLQRVLDNLSR